MRHKRHTCHSEKDTYGVGEREAMQNLFKTAILVNKMRS